MSCLLVERLLESAEWDVGELWKAPRLRVQPVRLQRKSLDLLFERYNPPQQWPAVPVPLGPDLGPQQESLDVGGAPVGAAPVDQAAEVAAAGRAGLARMRRVGRVPLVGEPLPEVEAGRVGKDSGLLILRAVEEGLLEVLLDES